MMKHKHVFPNSTFRFTAIFLKAQGVTLYFLEKQSYVFDNNSQWWWTFPIVIYAEIKIQNPNDFVKQQCHWPQWHYWPRASCYIITGWVLCLVVILQIESQAFYFILQILAMMPCFVFSSHHVVCRKWINYVYINKWYKCYIMIYFIHFSIAWFVVWRWYRVEWMNRCYGF